MSFKQYSDDRLDVEIAIIGMAGRFPGADDINQFWRNIERGVESVRDVDEQELDKLGVTEAQRSHPAYVSRAVDFSGPDLFDAEFFGFSPREASQLDPQQRVFLETVWHALENAGYAGRISDELVGTYAGCGANTYLTHNLLAAKQGESDDIADLLGLMNGNDKDSLSARVAYQFNLRGPAITIQTACSTSLVAVHQACAGLLNQEADIALAGGVWLNLLQKGGYQHQEGAILSADGHCRPFDEDASGTLIGSGAGVVILKRLRDALTDGDHIHAVIKGSAVNNDGADKVGFSAPSISGQSEVILAAQAMADVEADAIDYVEAHGTGTVLGDPIEMSALTQAFRQTAQGSGYCALGSVKSNIGHLDAAAGVAGLIKTVQALKYKTLPPSLNYNYANPQINFADSPFYVNTQSKPWDNPNGVRTAAVSSFGMGGTNAHVILQESLVAETAKTPSKVGALPLSARSAVALATSMQNLADDLNDRTELELDTVANTLVRGRQHFRHRAVVLLDDGEQPSTLLTKRDELTCVTGEVAVEDPELAFLFPGQGAQHPNMALDLYRTESVFKTAADECCDILKPLLDEDLRAMMWPEPQAEKQAAELLQQTCYTQPALFVIEYAMAQWWINQGVKPVALLGHSIGEYVAACISGVFSLDDALKLVAQRGRLLQQTEAGAMLSVSADAESLTPWLEAGCDLAAINGPNHCVLAGTVEAIEAAQKALSAQDIGNNPLHVSKAFHSSLVEPMLAVYHQLLDSVQKHAPQMPFVSNVSGQWITPEQAQSSDYWCTQVRATVQFSKGLETLASGFAQVYLEVGPGENLTTLAKRHPDCERRIVLTSQTHPQRLSQNAMQPRRCLAKLWTIGYGLDLKQLCFGDNVEHSAVTELPGYPFERKSYWVSPKAVKSAETEDEFLDLDRWFNLPTWVRTDNLPAVTPILEDGQAILVYTSQSDLCSQFVKTANDLNLRVITVEHNEAQGIEQTTTDQYRLDVTDKAALLELLQQLQQAEVTISQVVHFATLGVAQHQQIQELGFFSLLALAQAYGESELAELSLLVVTDQLEQVSGEEKQDAAKATLLAPCRVIPQEYAGVNTTLVDLPASFQTRRYVDYLLTELQHCGAQPSTRVAYRGQLRFSPDYLPVERGQGSNTPVLKTQGVYVITGGLGGIGLSLAAHLASQWQARLVLISRSPLPEQAQWSQLVNDVEQPQSLRNQLQQLLELQAMGAQLHIVAADVADKQALHNALEEVKQQLGCINGVIHGAGIAGGGLMAHKTREDTEAVWAAKVQGTQNLVACLAETRLDFMLFCSSTTAIVGGMGSLDYCAANAYLDVYARQLGQISDTPVISVNWDSWREVGMAAFLSLPEGYGITPQLGAQAFERILQGPVASNVIISTVDFQRQLDQQSQPNLPQHLPTENDGEGMTITHERPALKTPYAEPEDELQQQLADMLSGFLGVAPVGIHDNLFELGGDSLMAIQLLSKVQKQFGVELQPAEFFKLPTVAELASNIEWYLIEQIEQAEV